MAKNQSHPKKRNSKSESVPSRMLGTPRAQTDQTAQDSRRLKPTPRSWRRPSTWRRPHAPPAPLPKARIILRQSLQQLRIHPKVVVSITALYGIAMLLLVRGFSVSQDISTIKTLLDSVFAGNVGKAQSTVLQLSFLFSEGNRNSSAEPTIYQTVVLVIFSLAFIWALRNFYAKKRVTTKTALYKGMTPLVPFLLVLVIIGVQLLPLSFASLVYNNAIGAGLAVQAWEKLVAVAICLLLVLWSLRMLTGSIIALYVVTLPDMGPVQAIRSANNLVRYRRLAVWRKLMFLLVSIIVATSILVLPFLLFFTPMASWVFFVVSVGWFPAIHGFVYHLYRELLG